MLLVSAECDRSCNTSKTVKVKRHARESLVTTWLQDKLLTMRSAEDTPSGFVKDILPAAISNSIIWKGVQPAGPLSSVPVKVRGKISFRQQPYPERHIKAILISEDPEAGIIIQSSKDQNVQSDLQGGLLEDGDRNRVVMAVGEEEKSQGTSQEDVKIDAQDTSFNEKMLNKVKNVLYTIKNFFSLLTSVTWARLLELTKATNCQKDVQETGTSTVHQKAGRLSSLQELGIINVQNGSTGAEEHVVKGKSNETKTSRLPKIHPSYLLKSRAQSKGHLKGRDMDINKTIQNQRASKTKENAKTPAIIREKKYVVLNTGEVLEKKKFYQALKYSNEQSSLTSPEQRENPKVIMLGRVTIFSHRNNISPKSNDTNQQTDKNNDLRSKLCTHTNCTENTTKENMQKSPGNCSKDNKLNNQDAPIGDQDARTGDQDPSKGEQSASTDKKNISTGQSPGTTAERADTVQSHGMECSGPECVIAEAKLDLFNVSDSLTTARKRCISDDVTIIKCNDSGCYAVKNDTDSNKNDLTLNGADVPASVKDGQRRATAGDESGAVSVGQTEGQGKSILHELFQITSENKQSNVNDLSDTQNTLFTGTNETGADNGKKSSLHVIPNEKDRNVKASIQMRWNQVFNTRRELQYPRAAHSLTNGLQKAPFLTP